jgi:putative nucleotidyltransferase with HDIG domain
MWTISDNMNWDHLEAQFGWVKRMRDVPQDAIHHAEGNVAIHTKMVLEALEQLDEFKQLQPQEQNILRASALLHDVEKFSTTIGEPDGRITAPGHARRGAQTTRSILYRDIATPFAIREQVAALVRYHGLPLWLLEKKDPLKELVKASLEVNTQWLSMLARADALGRTCSDPHDLLYRLDCFDEFCREHACWGNARAFTSDHARMHYLLHEDAYVEYVPFDQPVAEVVMMSGLPGAGKDSYIKKHFRDMPVVSLDGIREEMDIDPTDKSGNGQAIQEAKERARVLLRKQQGFVWNATNTTRQMRTQLIELFMTYKAAVRIVYIEAPYQSLFSQNRNRDAVVPAAAIERLIDKLEVPVLWEAHRVEYIL